MSLKSSTTVPSIPINRGKGSHKDKDANSIDNISSRAVDALSVGSFISRFVDYLLSSFLTSSNKKAWRKSFSSLSPMTRSGQPLSGKALEPTVVHSKYQLLLQFIRKYLGRLTSGLLSLVNLHKSSVWVYCRIAVLSYVGLSIGRRIHHWISGMTEYELLLDPKDYLYQTQGDIP